MENTHEEFELVKSIQNYSKLNTFQLLPEIWESILLHLNDSDFQSIINSFPQWRNVLKSETASRLLPLILLIIFCNCHTSLPNKYLVNFRQVCKSTKAAVDKMLQESPRQVFDRLTTKEVEWNPDILGDLGATISRMNEYHKIVATSETVISSASTNMILGLNEWNPEFLTRTLVFPLAYNANLLTEEIPDIVLEYGHTISSMRFNGQTRVEFPELYWLLRFSPNLEILGFNANVIGVEEEELTGYDAEVTLPQLKLLEVGVGCGEIGAHFLEQFSPQLNSLILTAHLFTEDCFVRVFNTVDFRNLRCIQIDDVNSLTLKWLLVAIRRMEVPPMLEKIQFVDTLARCDSFCFSFMEIVLVLNVFSESLEHFQFFVSLTKRATSFCADDMRTSMPKLKTFSTTLANIHTGWFWPFVELECPNLEELNLHGDKLEERDILKVKIVLDSFPKLRKIVVYCGFGSKEAARKRIVYENDGTHHLDTYAAILTKHNVRL